MLEQLKNDVIRIMQWCKNHKKISVTIAIVLTLIIGSVFVFGEMFDDGDNRFSDSPFKQGFEKEGFENSHGSGDFGGDDFGGDEKASLNPQLAIINLLIVTGVAVIVGVGTFLFIYSNKKKTKPLPVLYNPIKDSDKEVR